ncbi:hypothetical protein JEZ13_00660 [bacterium]|nr:hypothetical protein [bacterium]
MQKISPILIIVLIISIISIACTQEDSKSQAKVNEFTQDQVRNRNLKTAIEDYNKGLYKGALSSIDHARSQRLRDEDIDIMNTLSKRITEKTRDTIDSLRTLANSGELHLYDFKYNQVTSNHEISSFRDQLMELNNNYLQRVQTVNDSYLIDYYSAIETLQNNSEPKIENRTRLFISKTSTLRLRALITGYEQPKLYLDFHPSQKEPELETIKFSSKNNSVSFKKNNLIISGYNVSASKIITFNLLNQDSEINLTNLKNMLNDGGITIYLKWFYDPETVYLPTKTVKSLKEFLTAFEKLNEEYLLHKDKIYVPKYVK